VLSINRNSADQGLQVLGTTFTSGTVMASNKHGRLCLNLSFTIEPLAASVSSALSNTPLSSVSLNHAGCYRHSIDG